MGSKLQDLKTLNVPGAGNYEPSLTFTKQAGPNYSMGIKLKRTKNSSLMTRSMTGRTGEGLILSGSANA
jgi:hypothetical protein